MVKINRYRILLFIVNLAPLPSLITNKIERDKASQLTLEGLTELAGNEYDRA
jgi:hypothetical protein